MGKSTFIPYYLAMNKELSLNDILILPDRYRAQLINSLSGFKSCNMIGTVDREGQSNLAIFSSVTHLGSTPPLMLLVSRPDSVGRHSLENIRETKVFTINHVNTSIYEKAHQTSARYPKEVSEFKAVGLTEEYRQGIQAPFVEESKIKMAL